MPDLDYTSAIRAQRRAEVNIASTDPSIVNSVRSSHDECRPASARFDPAPMVNGKDTQYNLTRLAASHRWLLGLAFFPFILHQAWPVEGKV